MATIAAAQIDARAGTGKTVARAMRQHSRAWPVKAELIRVAILGIVAVISRAPYIGVSQPHIDDQFYLLVADRMWHGALPYVDIWDRKPIGLFLLYAMFRPLSGNGIVAYQVAALLFAVATAYVIAQLGQRLGSRTASLAAGALYLLYLPIVGGGGGQSPVFYNLFVAIAALCTVKADESSEQRVSASFGLLAMLLVGLAIQVKYTAFVEGIGFGLYFLGLRWSRSRRIIGTLGLGLALVTAALLPTILAYAYFVARGAGPQFLQANFFSIFLTSPEPPGAGVTSLDFLCQTSIKMAPLLLLASVAVALRLRSQKTKWATPLLCWCAFAALGFAIIGRFYGHYALPTLTPLSLVAVPLLDSPVAAGLALAIAYSYAGLVPHIPREQANAHIDQLASALRPYAAQGCVYLRDGPPIVYLVTRSCLPTAFVFPEHLTTVLEARATNATPAMAQLLKGRPSAIVLSDVVPQRAPNPETQRLLADALASDYRLAAVITQPDGVHHESIFARKDLVPPESDSGQSPPASRPTW